MSTEITAPITMAPIEITAPVYLAHKGEKGDKGDKGDTGDQGPPGAGFDTYADVEALSGYPATFPPATHSHALLDSATASATPSTLVLRDASGNTKVNRLSVRGTAGLFLESTTPGEGVVITSILTGEVTTEIVAGGKFAMTTETDGVPNKFRVPTTTESTTARTIQASDRGTKIRCTNASGCALTINTGVGVAGEMIIVRRVTGAGSITLAGTATINNGSAVSGVSAGQEFALMAVDADTWDFV